MAIKYTEEQLNSIDHGLLVQMFLNQQEQMEQLTKEVHDLNGKIQNVIGIIKIPTYDGENSPLSMLV